MKGVAAQAIETDSAISATAEPMAHVLPGYPDAIDAVAAMAAPARRFLRRAWFAGSGDAGAVTLVGRRADGTAFAAIPTLPVGPAVAAARTVPGAYWPYRFFPVTEDAEEGELADLLSCDAARAVLGRVWRLGPVYRADPATKLLVRAARKAGWTVLKRSLGTTFVQDIGAASAAGQWPRKSKLRRVRAARHKLDAQGGYGLRFVRGAAWSDALLGELGDIEARSWVGKSTDGSGAKFLTEDQRAYWRRALADPVLADMFSAVVLDVAGKPVAFTFDLTVGALQYGIASSYDADWSAFAPGHIVTHHHLVESLARGVTQVDWGAGDGGYKREIGAEAGSEIVDCLFVRGRALAAILRTKWKLPPGDGDPAVPVEGLGRTEQALIASLGMAAAAAAFIE
ncbi:MAG: GNAT family N-acetyltransferase [Sphingomonas sp.]|nr:GNAT family N-acetyltransferase [Sphingomonas sp.]